MKTIGIKLADGSFYPVLEDNTPSEKKLELTTAHNNQTKVMVDLYRSATCSMEDAEYVDSLQIDNLNAHPNGEADIKFTVSLDEDNQLSAKIVDSETGNESDTTITLVSRTLEERLVTDEYDINDTEEKSDSKAGAVAGGALAAGGLLAAAAALRDKEAKNKAAEAEIESEPVIESEAASEPESEPEPAAEETEVETVEEEAPVEDETFVDEPVVEETIEESAEKEIITEDEPVFDETPVEEPADGLAIDEPIIEDSTDDIVIDEPVVEEADDDLVFEEPVTENETMEETESSEDITGELSDMDFDLPDDIGNTVTEDSEPVETTADFTSDETVTEDTISADDTITDDSTLPDMDFDIPDDTENIESEPELPDDFFNTDDLDNTEDTMNNTSFDTESPAAGGLNFDGLYDEETERGTPAQNDEDDVKKKTKVPVIICIICAIICIIATLLILFIIPSKYNLITKKHAKETVAVEAPAPEPSPAPVVEPEPEPEPAVPEAKEDEIIIIEKAEEVVPSQPPVAEEKPKDITYKIKWGDTLWDIADTYYKNPWRYKYIARYNGIRNPDYIISGTIITIPAQ